MKKKPLKIKDKKVKELMKTDGRKGAKEDFFELLKRAANSPQN